jgi:hypothetical protein
MPNISFGERAREGGRGRQPVVEVPPCLSSLMPRRGKAATRLQSTDAHPVRTRPMSRVFTAEALFFSRDGSPNGLSTRLGINTPDGSSKGRATRGVAAVNIRKSPGAVRYAASSGPKSATERVPEAVAERVCLEGGSGVVTVPFPQAALRTRPTRLRVPGSPQLLPSGWLSHLRLYIVLSLSPDLQIRLFGDPFSLPDGL